jgi:hypothetical protein
MFQNVFMDPKILKEKQITVFILMSFGIFVSFKKKVNLCVFSISYTCFFLLMSFRIFVSLQKKSNLCVFPISYTCLHVILYKCKYMLFHLNMLRLFLKINFFFSLRLS